MKLMPKSKIYLKIILSVWFCLCLLFLFLDPAYAGERFKCYENKSDIQCGNALIDSNECRINYDYNINIKDEGEDVVVLSIHGGLIEPYTSEVSADIAERFNWKRYDFSGHATEFCGKYFEKNCPKLNDGEEVESVRRNNFRNLHITSTKFNDKDAIDLVESNPKTVSIHGYSPGRKYDKGLICVGGSDLLKNTQVKDFIDYIDRNKEDLKIEAKDARNVDYEKDCGPTDVFSKLDGSDKNNIVNRNPNDAGLQLEFNYKMLKSIGDRSNSDYEEYEKYRDVIYGAIESAVSKFDG